MHQAARRERLDTNLRDRLDFVCVGKRFDLGADIQIKQGNGDRTHADHVLSTADFHPRRFETHACRPFNQTLHLALDQEAIQRERAALPVKRHDSVHLDGAGQVAGLHVEVQAAFERNRLSVAGDPAGREVDVGQLVAVTLLRVHIADGRIADTDTRDVQRTLASRVRRLLTFACLEQVIPVSTAPGVHGKAQAQAGYLGGADFRFLPEQQRQQAHTQARLVEFGKGLVAESVRIAERGMPDLDRQPRKQLH